jgi:hypothetical protein
MLALTLAALLAAPAAVAMHPNATQTVSITGAGGAITAVSTDALVSATVDGSTVTIAAAAATGHDVVRVTDANGASVDLPVFVANDAASVPAAIALRVTGQPVDASWLGTQISAAVSAAVVAAPGAGAVTVTPSTMPPPPPGASAAIPVAVHVDGNGTYLDVDARVEVTVQNVAAEPFAPPLLMYDDDPERVNADGVLYRGTVDADTPRRLYYYHDGGDGAHRLVVVLSAASTTAADVQVIDAGAGPSLDVLSVGHAVTRNFLQADAANQGLVLTVAPGRPVVLHDVLLGPRVGAAGNIDLQILGGGAVTVTVLAVPPDGDPLAALGGPVLPGDGHHRTGLFNLANYGTRSLAYAVGDPDLRIAYGDRDLTPPNADPGGLGHDFGDYGVTQTFLFSMSNPAASDATVYLYERPIGGVVRSTFVVDGSLAQVGCVRDSAQRYSIYAVSLAAGKRYLMRVDTMTDGSSAYPIEIGLTTTPPQPAAPPISAPDGCFPKPSSGTTRHF